jgi:tetratricopeptide (TPR) repeat protein
MFDYYDEEDRKIGGLTVTDVHLTSGQQALRTRWYDKAYSEAQWVLNQFPNHPQGLILLVQTCEKWQSPRCTGIDEAFKRAIAINPNAPGTYTTMGIYLHRKHQYAEAIKSFQQALKLDPNSFNAQYNIGLAYFETKQYDLANQYAQRAYALGAPFPALRSKLQQVGHWKPIPTPDQQPAEASPQPPAGGQGGAVKK